MPKSRKPAGNLAPPPEADSSHRLSKHRRVFDHLLASIQTGALKPGASRILWLGAGALIGAQLGAKLSERVHGKWILRSLAVGLMFVGIRVLLLAV